MTIFQLIMLLAAGFFAYQVYLHIQNIDENMEPSFSQEPELIEPTQEELVKEADKAFMDGDIKKAQALLESIVSKYPSFAEAMNKLAYILTQQEDYENAQKYYEISLGINPNDDMTHIALAKLFALTGKNIQAQEHYKLALKIDDNYEITWFNYATLMASLGEKDEARKMYKKALEIDPDYEQAKIELEKLDEK